MGEMRVEHVPCFVHDDIQGDKIPETPDRFPFSAAFLDQLAASCPVVVEFLEPGEGQETPLSYSGQAEGQAIGLEQLSPHHRRSFELFIGSPDNHRPTLATWAEESGAFYTSLSLKGNNFTQPLLFGNTNSPSGYAAFGLQTTESIRRIVRVTEMLVSEKIGTEKIVRIMEPEMLRAYKVDPETDSPIKNEFEYVTQAEYKRRLLAMHWRENADKPASLEELQKAGKALSDLSFFITLRATSIGYRIHDLAMHGDTFEPQIEKMFGLINAFVEFDQRNDELDPKNPEDILFYAKELLPETVGYNFGRLHKAGLVHGFPTPSNIDAFGHIVDSDSVTGAPLGLGDPEHTAKDYFRDMCYMLQGDNRRIMRRFALNVLEHTQGPDEEGGYNVNGFVSDYFAMVMASYFHSRFNIGEDVAAEEADIIGMLDFIDANRRAGFDGYRYTNHCRSQLKYQLKKLSYSKKDILPFFAPTFPETSEQLKRIYASEASRTESKLRYFGHQRSQARFELAMHQAMKGQTKRAGDNAYYDAAKTATQTPEFQAWVDKWIDKYIKRRATLSHDTIKRLITLDAVDMMQGAYFEYFFDNGGEELRPQIHYLTHKIAPEIEKNASNKMRIQGIYANGTVTHILSRVGKQVLLDSVKPDDIPYAYQTEITYHPMDSNDIVIESTPEAALQQIFHDGPAIQDIVAKRPGNTYDNTATVRFSIGPKQNYVAWTTFSEADKKLHLHIAQR